MKPLPTPVGEFFKTAKAAGYTVICGRQQVMLLFSGCKVGGWNTLGRHWYVSKIVSRGRDEVMRRHGFIWKEREEIGHAWWQLDGEDNAEKFQSVVNTLTDVPSS